MTFLAEILTQARPFWEYSNPPDGMAAAGLFFLLLLCAGLTVDIGLVLYLIKRPVKLTEWRSVLEDRALPQPVVLLVLGAVVVLYLFNSLAYSLFFPDGEAAPHAVFFQTLFFHLPVLGLIGLLLRLAGISGRELFGLRWQQAPALLSLALLFYLAALPLLWFYSALYQIFLQQLGHEFLLQEVAQMLTAPAPWPVRAELFFIVIIVAPVFEEIIFRGILLPFFVSRTGFWPGITLISFLFAGLHWHLPSLLPLFLLSVMFSLAYARTRSLLVPMGMHAAFNGVTVLLLMMMGG